MTAPPISRSGSGTAFYHLSFPIDVFRDKVLFLGFSRSVSLEQFVCLPVNLRGVGLSFSWRTHEACEQALRGALAAGREKEERACNYVSGIWIPPVAPRRLSCQISASQREAETSANVNKLWKTRAKGNDVITNVISANQHFASTFSMQIFNFQRWVVLQAFLSFPVLKQECPGELARRLLFMLWNRPL